MEIILTGFRPTGELHLGHYFSIIRPLLDNKRYKVLILVADLHSWIDIRKKKSVDLISYQENINELTTLSLKMLFKFINPKRCIVIKQSDMAIYHYDLFYKLLMISKYSDTIGNPIFQEVMLNEYMNTIDSLNLDNTSRNIMKKFLNEHTEILWGHFSESLWNELACRLECNISTQRLNEIFKYINNKNVGVLGFATYPILMAADILLYNPNYVLVGKDQEPHIQIANNLVKSMSKMFDLSVKKVRPLIADYATIKGSDGNKMSKTSKNFVTIKSILEDTDNAKLWISSLKTYSRSLHEKGDPDECVVGSIWKILFGGECFEMLLCREGCTSCSHCKQKLLINLQNALMRDFTQKEFDIERLLRNGKIQAKKLIKENTCLHHLINLKNLI